MAVGFLGETSAEKIIIAILLFIVVLVIGNLIYIILRKIFAKKISKHNSMLAASFIQYLFLGSSVYFGIYKGLNLNLSGLAASFGILTIAIAFSSQQLIQNLIAGIIISFQKPIEIGDWVDIGPGTGISKVKEIKLMRTFVRDINGKINSLSNASVLTARIINYTESGFIEIPVQISVPCDSDLETIKKILIGTANKNKKILPNVSPDEGRKTRMLLKIKKISEMFNGKFEIDLFKPKVYTISVSPQKINLEIRFWIREIEKKDEIVSEFLEALVLELKTKKINL